MPKFIYDKHYGALTMLPVYFSWLSVLVLPLMIVIKDKETLRKINKFCFILVYAPFSLVLVVVFISVNLLLLPIAYFKTLIHKALLFQRYRNSSSLQNLFIFFLLGIPLLVLALFPDTYRFVRHTYTSRLRQQQDRNY